MNSTVSEGSTRARAPTNLVYVRYSDHVHYSRCSPFSLAPQVRETRARYLIISWDRDAGPPTLRGGEPKASGLVLLKSDILELKKLSLKEGSWCHLNSTEPIVNVESALQSKKRKTQTKKRETAT